MNSVARPLSHTPWTVLLEVEHSYTALMVLLEEKSHLMNSIAQAQVTYGSAAGV